MRHCKSWLPEYMTPGVYVCLDELPLTPNGKVDRNALPLPEVAEQAAGYEEPRGETEMALAAIWRDILQVGRVGRHDNFFDLGGHSLLAMRLVARVRRVLGRELELRETV